ncbi:alpha/beta hydrolase [Pseudonocardia sp. HH130629-09]|uniref:alpha/beta hydrolase n=1 Tax=Pseudonocardia sp. HH130629-09 TaxID=1641402 RepID=UPI000761B8DE|nr:alpha/beta hydrolase [Pseudonocardia sp. HH130629-09]
MTAEHHGRPRAAAHPEGPEPVGVLVTEHHRPSIRSRVLTAVMDQLMARALRALTGDTLTRALRDRLARFDEWAAHVPVPWGARVGRTSVNGLPAEWSVGRGVRDPDAVVLYLHGGGWLFGGLNSHRSLVSRLSSASGQAALAVAYRMVPEVSLDQEIEDCLDAYRWLLARGIAPGRIAIAGDSAGGHLAVATALRARERGLPRPAAVVGMSGVYDLDTAARAALDPGDDPTGSAAALQWMIEMILAGDAPDRYSPLRADLADLPPTLLTVGSAEVLREETEQLARRLAAAGAHCVLEIWHGQPHVFQVFAPVLPEAARSLDRIGTFLRSAFAGTARPLPGRSRRAPADLDDKT